jgi:hypothetical protein
MALTSTWNVLECKLPRPEHIFVDFSSLLFLFHLFVFTVAFTFLE